MGVRHAYETESSAHSLFIRLQLPGLNGRIRAFGVLSIGLIYSIHTQ